MICGIFSEIVYGIDKIKAEKLNIASSDQVRVLFTYHLRYDGDGVTFFREDEKFKIMYNDTIAERPCVRIRTKTGYVTIDKDSGINMRAGGYRSDAWPMAAFIVQQAKKDTEKEVVYEEDAQQDIAVQPHERIVVLNNKSIDDIIGKLYPIQQGDKTSANAFARGIVRLALQEIRNSHSISVADVIPNDKKEVKEENKRLKAELKTARDGRDAFASQVMRLRQENERLQEELAKANESPADEFTGELNFVDTSKDACQQFHPILSWCEDGVHMSTGVFSSDSDPTFFGFAINVHRDLQMGRINVDDVAERVWFDDYVSDTKFTRPATFDEVKHMSYRTRSALVERGYTAIGYSINEHKFYAIKKQASE